MICPAPGCNKPVDTHKEHVVVKKIMSDYSELAYHWHWKCYVEAGGK